MENNLPGRAIDRWLFKVRHIMPTLVLIIVISIPAMMAIRWLLMQAGIEPKEDVWQFWIPMAFPWIPLIIWLRPKARIIIHPKGQDPSGARWAVLIIAWIVVMLPMIISQFYVSDATGSLLTVNDVADLRSKPHSKYYQIRNFDVDTSRLALGEDVRTSGKYNQHLDITFYFVVPITVKNEPADLDGMTVWYGVRYSHQISNQESQSWKEEQYNKLFETDFNDITHYNFQKLDYFKTTPNSGDLDGFKKAIVRVGNELPVNALVLQPVSGSFETRTGSTLKWLFGTTIIGLVIFSLFLMLPAYTPPGGEVIQRTSEPGQNDLKEYLSYLIPKQPHFVTSLIIDVCLLVMVGMLLSGVHPISPDADELMAWGANRKPETIGGQWWRLVSSMFVHGGIIHLVFNLYGLVLGAMFIESLLGPVRYAVIYFISGIAGSIASIAWNPFVASVGASGAIFGLFGANLALALTDHVSKETRQGYLKMFGPYVAINLVYGFLSPGIDNAAHIGGLVTGFFLGLIMFKMMVPENAELD